MKGRRTWRGLASKLRQDRVAEGLGGDAGAVGDKEHGAIGHGRRAGVTDLTGGRADDRARTPYNPPQSPPRLNHTMPDPGLHAQAAAVRMRPRRRMGAPLLSHHGAFPCLPPSLATALVVPFEHLRMTDVEVGRRQERQPRRNDQPAGRLGRARAGGFATTAHAFRAVPARTTAWRSASRRGWTRSTPRTCARWPKPAPQIRAWIEAQPFPPDLRQAVRAQFAQLTRRQPPGQLRGALVGHRRRPARCLLRRPAGDLSQRGRHRRGAAQDEGGVRLALQRPRHQLPRAQGLRPCRRGLVGRRAAHGALRPGARPA